MQRPHPHPFNNTTLPLLYSPDPYRRLQHILHLLSFLLLPLPGSPRLPVAGAHVTPLEGRSPVGGHCDVFSGRSPWTVTGPLLDLHVLLDFFLFIH